MTLLHEDELVRLEVVEGRVAVLTLLGGNPSATFPWGTRICEHRLNPPLIRSVERAMARSLEETEVSSIVVTAQGGFFSNGMDLQYISAHMGEADALQRDCEALLAAILTFPLPTIAAINGHFCAAGAMLGLAFDYRFMNADKGLCFVPGVDIGLVYSPGMSALMAAKLPNYLHTDFIVYGKRFDARSLERERLVSKAVTADQVLPEAIGFALELTKNMRFKGEKYRETVSKLKKTLHSNVHQLLLDTENFRGMGFATGTWNELGRSRI